jgi:hypothetical protein
MNEDIGAAEMNRLFSMMPKHLLDEQAKCLLSKCSGILKNKIGIIHILRTKRNYNYCKLTVVDHKVL